MEHVEFTYTGGLDREVVQERLASAETGVLALAEDGDAYAIPLAFHYDGEDAILLRLGEFEGSEKMSHIAATERACFVVYDYASPTDSWSVLVTGPLVRVPEDEERFDDAEINRRFPDIRVFDQDIAEVDVVLYELRIESMTGRETVEST